MKHSPTLSDLLCAHANVLSLGGDGRSQFSSKACELQMRDLLLTIFDTPHTLKASAMASAPLIPGYTYRVSQLTNANFPEGIVLESEYSEVCISVMDFFNAFHEQSLPEHEHEQATATENKKSLAVA